MAYDRAHRPDVTGSQSSGGGGGHAPGSDPKVGTYFLGRYRVVDEIGIGGMASVHLARMDGPGGFQKWIAIKRIHAHLVEDDSFVQMFLDEARVAARISHPNVATVFELGKHEDTYWIAMEYLHGEPLREVMRRTEELGAPMPPEIACRVIADAAEGLHAAHELLGKNGEKLGLVHRDVTPHNLFVTYDGNTKVVDFGIAKFSSRMSSTRAGTLKGKLAYMSPEQVHGEAIDRRTDIFALGVVLWELTTGQRLFRMESDLDTLAKVQECNVPRPSTLVRGYPIDLEKIVMKALAKNRGERFKTAREFSRALQSLLMRRGLFIASDEVSSYVQSIFADRIQKREAHLRWAAEVTQTISLDGPGAAALAETGSLIAVQQGFNQSGSHGAASGGRIAAPRPAAGVPARVPAGGMPSSPGIPPTQVAGGVPQHPLASTHPMGNAGLPRQHGGPPSAAPQGPSTRPLGLSPSAGVPGARPDTFRPPAARGLSGDAAHAALMSTAETPINENSAPYDDGPTIQGSSAFDDAAPPNVAGEEYDDNDATVVTMTKVDGGGPGQIGRPGPLPAAGRRIPSALDESGETRAATNPAGTGARDLHSTVPLGTMQSAPVGAFPLPAGFRPSQPQMPTPANPFGQTQRASFAPPAGPGAGASPEHGGGGGFAGSPPTEPFFSPGASGAMPGLAPNDGQHAMQRPSNGARVAALDFDNRDNRTVTARSLKRGLPMWAVAVASGLVALLFVGVIYALLSRGSSSSPNATKKTAAAGSTGAAAGAGAGAGGAVEPTTKGPFGVTRAAFNAAVAPPPAPSPSPTTGALPGPGGAVPSSLASSTTTATGATTALPQSAAAASAATPAAPAAAPAHASGGSSHSGASAHAEKQSVGYLTVICKPNPCDQILDNGNPLGGSPIFRQSVPAGYHKLTLKSGTMQKILSVFIQADELKVQPVQFP